MAMNDFLAESVFISFFIGAIFGLVVSAYVGILRQEGKQ